MTKFTDEDFEFLQRKAEKLGFQVIKKTDIPDGHEDEYIDLSTIDISEVFCLQQNYGVGKDEPERQNHIIKK